MKRWNRFDSKCAGNSKINSKIFSYWTNKGYMNFRWTGVSFGSFLKFYFHSTSCERWIRSIYKIEYSGRVMPIFNRDGVLCLVIKRGLLHIYSTRKFAWGRVAYFRFTSATNVWHKKLLNVIANCVWMPGAMERAITWGNNFIIAYGQTHLNNI